MRRWGAPQEKGLNHAVGDGSRQSEVVGGKDVWEGGLKLGPGKA